MSESHDWSRRRVLRAGISAAGVYATGVYTVGVHAASVYAGGVYPAGAVAPASATRHGLASEPRVIKRVTLQNPHTLESLDVPFLRDDGYDAVSLAKCESLLRDLRTGETQSIDRRLFDYLHDVAERLGVDPTFSVISGYRSASADRARELGGGATRPSPSLHTQGRALDVRLAGVASAELAGAALGMARGGVGFYRRADFVHLDTGAVRSWRG